MHLQDPHTQRRTETVASRKVWSWVVDVNHIPGAEAASTASLMKTSGAYRSQPCQVFPSWLQSWGCACSHSPAVAQRQQVV